MNKSEWINVVAEQAELSKAEATRAVDALTDTITNTLKSLNDVAITGFGTFTTSERAARTGRNPQTGEPIAIAAATLPKFKAGKALKDSLKGA